MFQNSLQLPVTYEARFHQLNVLKVIRQTQSHIQD